MTTRETRPLDAAPPLPPLSPQAEVALLARMLFREGYDDHLAGHITYKQADDTLLCNPFALTWDELTASDIMRIDLDGNVLDGQWSVTPAIQLHLALHRLRPDITVAIHNHPKWGTIWADVQRVPGIYDQTSAAVAGELALHDEYEGNVADRANAEAAARALGDAKWALLANHGVLVVGDSIKQAHLRAVTLEWRCRQAWHVEAVGGGVTMKPDIAEKFGTVLDAFGFPGMFEAMARREVRADASVLH